MKSTGPSSSERTTPKASEPSMVPDRMTPSAIGATSMSISKASPKTCALSAPCIPLSSFTVRVSPPISKMKVARSGALIRKPSARSHGSCVRRAARPRRPAAPRISASASSASSGTATSLRSASTRLVVALPSRNSGWSTRFASIAAFVVTGQTSASRKA